MRICVYGAGSLGSAVGGLLAGNNEVSFIGRPANVAAIRENGLGLRGAVEKTADVNAHTSIEGLPSPELLLITTKSYNTLGVIETCRDWVDDDTKVLTLQNGLGNLEPLREWRGRSTFGATTTMGAVLLSPGIVHISGIGTTVIGADLDPDTAAVISTMFNRAGIRSRVSNNVEGEIWAKVIVNASINPISAVLRVTNGRLLESSSVSRLMSEICLEGEKVARSAGITLPVTSAYERACEVARETASNRSSMLRDVELGRKTEIASINGHICRVGVRMGVPTPLNRTMVAIVESLETLPAEKG